MSRPSFEQIYMRLALDLARRSTCSRLQVGCVVTSTDYTRVFGVGYNGNARGHANGCDDPDKQGGCGCLHAEDNALLKVSESPETTKVMFVTHLPCKMCAKRIINKGGFTTVYYHMSYRLIDSYEILQNSGIRVISLGLD